MIKRFLLTNREFNKDGYNCYSNGDIFLYASNDCDITVIDDFIIIGSTFSCLDKNIEELIFDVKNNLIDIWEMIFYLSGSYVIIYKNRIYMDYAGLSGLFYAKNNEEYIISNDLWTFIDEFGYKKINDFSTKWDDFFNYVPAPLTTVIDVFKLYNDQYIEIVENGIILNKTSNKLRLFKLSKKELVVKIEDAFNNLLRDAENKYDDIVLSLTAGVDSRTTFSLMLNSGMHFRTYTHYVPNIPQYDVEIPKLLSNKYSIKHDYLINGDYNSDKAYYYDNFICNSIDDGDKYAYSNGIDYPDGKKTLVLKSAIFETIINYYDSTFNLKEINKDMFLDKCLNIQPSIENTIIFQSLSMWFDHYKEYKNEDFYNYLLLSQRNGAWSSYTDRGLAIFDSSTINLSNCAYIMSLFNSFPNKMKNHRKDNQRYVIKSIDKELTKYKYNSGDFNGYKHKIKQFIKNKIIRK